MTFLRPFFTFRHNGDINLRNESGATALHCATLNSRFAAAQLLVDMGTNLQPRRIVPPPAAALAFPLFSLSSRRKICLHTVWAMLGSKKLFRATHTAPRHTPPSLRVAGASRCGARLAGQDGLHRAGACGVQWAREAGRDADQGRVRQLRHHYDSSLWSIWRWCGVVWCGMVWCGVASGSGVGEVGGGRWEVRVGECGGR